MTERVVVVGAGVGGLCVALSLAPTGRTVVLLERDGSPPGVDPDAVFEAWRRPGVGHLRQSHAFLARLRTIIKTEHPELLERLLSLGVRELPFEAFLTERQRQTYVPQPEDKDLTIITSRRTTLELAMRGYVEELANVSIRTGVHVRRLLTRRGADGGLEVVGVAGVVPDGTQDETQEILADLVVDASGRSGFLMEQLREEGALIAEESESAGILYFTRHYRLRPGADEPPRTGAAPSNGDLGFLKFGVFPGDRGCFSITIAVPEAEMELRKAVVDPDQFQRITQLLPGLRPWTDPARAEARGRVHGMGDLVSRWRDLVLEGRPAARGYFALGDVLVRTNPLYGRGCCFAAVSAEALRRSLDRSGDPAARLLDYHSRIRAELRPFYLNQRAQDRAAIARARAALSPRRKRTLRARLLKGFLEDGVRIALRSDVALLRQALRGFHMLEHPDRWLAKPGNLARVLGYWLRGRKRNASLYPPRAGPRRTDMLQALSVDWEADLIGPQRAA